jgi:hypothetical protein
MKLYRAKNLEALPDYQLAIEFVDGTRGILSLKDELWGPVFEPLKVPAYFAKVYLDEDGVICWPHGLDLAPDGIYHRIKSAQNIKSEAAQPHA